MGEREGGPSRYFSHARSEERHKQDLKAGKLGLFSLSCQMFLVTLCKAPRG